ncbi:hypothetical protein WOLCODRAFT_166840 [Wolfiporia cocos MD-104 SS10]|uniref:Uncharacterized protein n=1 Tax=Wolfiporia cocos (strain MD-104) TaxID=742152 RepID=A0A2H3J236_WOLCO|nr:hypothetical protein WOLCODRAFT_166840 [Wolfiporia cocos MD-104 SS10]
MLTTSTTGVCALVPVHPYTCKNISPTSALHADTQHGDSTRPTALDIAFASSDVDAALAAPRMMYYPCARTPTWFIDDVIALGLPGSDSTDTWSLDAHGVLTLAVHKPPRGNIAAEVAPLNVNTLDQKQHGSLLDWDARCGPWRVLYTLQGVPHAQLLEGSLEHVVTPAIMALPAIHFSMARTHKQTGRRTSLHSSNGRVWRACMLRAGDVTDPYVAVYAPPAQTVVASATHVRWTGLLHPSLVTDVATALTERSARGMLAAMAVHGVPTAPAVYVHADTKGTAPCAPWEGAEDTWCMLLGRNEQSREKEDA